MNLLHRPESRISLDRATQGETIVGRHGQPRSGQLTGRRDGSSRSFWDEDQSVASTRDVAHGFLP